LMMVQMAFRKRSMLERYVEALQEVIDRHDILRTAFVWEGLRTAAQVVLRKVELDITEVQLQAHEGPPASAAAEALRAGIEELAERFDPRHYRLDLTQAPLLRAFTARETASGRWLVVLLMHHLIGDHSTLELINSEVLALVEGRGQQLPPSLPFRNQV